MSDDTPIQSKGGKARDKALSAERKKEIAKRAAEARWKNAPLKSTHDGVWDISDTVEIDCSVVEQDGKHIRLLSQRGITKALGGKRGGSHWKRIKENPDGAILPVYASANNLKPFINSELEAALTSPVKYRMKTGVEAFGLPAELLPEVCDIFLKAREAGKLHPSQEHIAKQAEILVRSFAKVGVIAIVDEVTGFQNERAKNALADILEEFIAKELQAWTSTFPLEFYEQIFRLKGWAFDPASVKRPAVIGHYTNDFIYKRLAPGVLEELKTKNPKVDGRRKHKHFQWLTGEVGHPKLLAHIETVKSLMKISNTWDEFKERLDIVYPIVETTELGLEVEVKSKK